ncbi:ParB/RepB/Spo0J family partition protein [[Clostridium] scindens]|uniref:ParB/RepB/Spo0J family partition protein n=1 Tax=Clostridium scindens (strain JCM 10418 / VPI 12708) TaxID=29347 RepID=UPI001AA0ECC8|nr:ParB N-terminal domain-containing protein [[Clostridium] scindens]MBO1684266.1 ParB N-terminal domain-containing protein [[Clostridium] scindens]
MGKFNVNKIKGAGEGLLNEISKMQKVNEMQIIYILPDQIDKAEENEGISIDRIEELADSIADVGLINALVLRQKEDGRYRIVAGERRYTAILSLIEDGRWEKDRPIKSSLFDPQLIDLPLTEEEKEDYVRATENAEQRNKTDGDKLLQMRKLMKIYEKLRENGAISNVKTRTLLAADMKMAPSHAAQFMKVDAKGSDELIDAVLDNQVSVSAASTIAGLPQEEQKEIVEKALQEKQDDKKITPKDLENAQQKIKAAAGLNENISEGAEEGARITSKIFQNDISVITKTLESDDILLDEKQYLHYLKNIKALEKIFKNA